MPEAQKLVCLKQLLAGDPLKLFNNIVGFDFLPGSLERVLRTLEDHFGGSQRIVNSYINRLTQYSPIRRFDCGSLLDLLTIVEEIFNRYESLPNIGDGIHFSLFVIIFAPGMKVFVLPPLQMWVSP